MLDDPQSLLASRALSIAASLAHASSGDKAEARRMQNGGSAIFWREAARLSLPHSQEENWRQFTKLIALLTPASRNDSIHASVPLGRALAQANFSEQRLARLIAARGPTRVAALERAIRMLSGKVSGLDVVDLARAVFWPENGTHIARSYYKELDNTPREEITHD